MLFTGVLIGVSFLDIGLALQRIANDPRTVFPVHFVTPVIRIVSFLVTLVLMKMHRHRGVRSSGTLFIFWIILLISGLPQLRSVLYANSSDKRDILLFIKGLLWKHHKINLYLIYISTVLVMFFLNCFSDRPPRDHVPRKNESPEIGASFPRKLIFQWFDMFMLRGVKKPVDVDNVYELNETDLATTLNKTFDRFWERRRLETKRSERASKPGSEVWDLIWALYKTAGYPLWTTAIIRIIIVASSLTLPQILG